MVTPSRGLGTPHMAEHVRPGPDTPVSSALVTRCPDVSSMGGVRMRRAVLWATASIAVLAGLVVGGASGASTTYTHGYDISWPQCSSSGSGSRAATLPPLSSSAFVIL